jgi:hypothetical protein
MHHDGTDSYIVNSTGELHISQSVSDADILISVNDSGSILTAVKIDASGIGKFMLPNDNQKLSIGAGDDFQIYHNGTNSYIDNNTGHIYFTTYADDKNLVFRTDDASGGVANYLIIDGASSIITVHKNMRFDDSVKGIWGAGSDLQLYHDGSNSYIDNIATGHLYIRNTLDNSDIIFQSDNNSGGLTNYIQLDGSEMETVFNQKIKIEDSKKLFIGSGRDLEIYHDGSHHYFDTNNGNFYFRDESDNNLFTIAREGNGIHIVEGDVLLSATGKLRLDNATSGNTYIHESSGDIMDFTVGGDLMLRLDEASGQVKFPQDDVMVSGSYLWAVGGTDDNISTIWLGHMADSANNPLFKLWTDDGHDRLEINGLRYSAKHTFTRGSSAGGHVHQAEFGGSSTTQLSMYHQSNVASTTGSKAVEITASTGSAHYARFMIGGGVKIETGSLLLTNNVGISGSIGSTGSLSRIETTTAGIEIGSPSSAHNYPLQVEGHAFVKGPDGWNGAGDLAIVALGSTVANESFGCGYKYNTGLILSIYKSGGGGSFGASTADGLIIADTTGDITLLAGADITGSLTSTASFGKIEADTYSLATLSEVSGGITSTGSFGRLDAHSDGIGSATLLHLDNYVGADLTQQQSYIDFSLRDSNDNHTPQVRIGAEVGHNGDANTQQKEGSGAFIVFTTNAGGTSTDLTDITEKFRVDYLGDIHIKSGSMNISGSILPTTDNKSDLGSAALRWDDVFAAQTTIGAVFETGLRTKGIGQHETGTIVVWRNGGLVPCDKDEDTMVMGVTKKGKDEPIVMGAEPVLVTGDVKEGDFITTSTKSGYGKKLENGYLLKKEMFGKVIAQALEDSTEESSLIKCMIRKM